MITGLLALCMVLTMFSGGAVTAAPLTAITSGLLLTKYGMRKDGFHD